MDQKTYIAFDQYQRYQTIYNVIEFYRGKDEKKAFTVLEIGSNEHKDLKLFLPNDKIVFTDVVLTEAMKQDPDFQQADGTNLPYEDGCFDFVVAADVLEHVSPEKRARFCHELRRVAKIASVICFPYRTPENIGAEERLNVYYKSLYGSDYVWLKEHSVCGLPGEDEIDRIYDTLNTPYIRFHHGNLGIWEKMWYCHFNTCGASETEDYRHAIDHYYNTAIYSSDIAEPCYRTFYISASDDVEGLRAWLESKWEKGGSKGDILNLILNQHQYMVERCEINHMEPTADTSMATVYWAEAEQRFQESNAFKQSYPASDHDLRIQCELPASAALIRFDPAEFPCVIEDLHIYSDVATLKAIPDNAIEYEGKYIFLDHDPRFQIILDGKQATRLDIRAHVTSLEHPEQEELLAQLFRGKEEAAQRERKLLERLDVQRTQHEAEMAQSRETNQNLLEQVKKNHQAALEEQRKQYDAKIQQLEGALGNLSEHCHMVTSQRDELTKQLELAKYEYSVISNAFYWKITAPLRKLTDLLKRPFRGNRHAQLVRKGIRCLRQNGVGYTWQKLKSYKRKQTPYQTEEPIYTAQELESQRSNQEAQTIKFSIIVPLYNTQESFLREMIDSVVQQTYRNWELCLADGSNRDHSHVEKICKAYSQRDGRILYQRLEKNAGISENTNACAAMASGDYIGLLDHDDLLMPNALYANFEAIKQTDADVLYSDEDHLSVQGTHISPFFKPDWSPDLLYGQMYICHFLVFKRTLFSELGGFRSQFDGSQDYDLMLRMSERTNRICHIPRILYSWRESENSTALNADAKPYSHTAGKAALDEHLKRKYGPKAHAEDSQYTFVYDARFGMVKTPKVSIIIPMKDKWEMTAECIESIVQKSTYKNFEIIVLDNRSEEEETKKWFERITEQEQRISVILADMEFNWSKLNNFGMQHATGDVYVFLNNDTLVISPDWLERLVENACRDEIGVVGGLLLYPDNTIQHAGVVVGMGGWADHIFKGMQPIHSVGPYVSPVISRNVLAVTGACMAVSRRTIERIGGFDERFIICGSDVELCIRAYEHGLFNRIDANVRLYHLESKSRDTYIPEIDFKMSYEVYGPYRENVDPYFNINLDRNSVIPKECVAPLNLVNFKNFLKRCPVTSKLYEQAKETLVPYDYTISEIQPLGAREGKDTSGALRLNLLIPSVDRKHVFGGIATALEFFQELCRQSGCNARIIVTDAPVESSTSVELDRYEIVAPGEDSGKKYQIIPMADRYGKTIPVGSSDVFVATGWWTAHVISDVCRWQKATYHTENPLIYIIQDYEPGFYPWSSRYMLADSTYRLEIPTYAVFNSTLLKDHFDKNGYRFTKSWTFDPVLNGKIKQFLPKDGTVIEKKKQILVYGRPSVERNAFSLIVYALKEWCGQYGQANEWQILSAGEQHADIELGNGCSLHSVGKLSLDAYSQMLLDSYVGISLMVSPHPSYPPLEMSTFGVQTITNRYEEKDLGSFNENIRSVRVCSPHAIAEELMKICLGYTGQGTIRANEHYAKAQSPLKEIVGEISALLG